MKYHQKEETIKLWREIEKRFDPLEQHKKNPFQIACIYNETYWPKSSRESGKTPSAENKEVTSISEFARLVDEHLGLKPTAETKKEDHVTDIRTEPVKHVKAAQDTDIVHVYSIPLK